MKRAADFKGKFSSVSFLKVLMPKIAKNSKRNPERSPSDAPNLVGNDRTKK